MIWPVCTDEQSIHKLSAITTFDEFVDTADTVFYQQQHKTMILLLLIAIHIIAIVGSLLVVL